MTDSNPLLEILNDSIRRGRDEQSRSDGETQRVVELRPLFSRSDLVRN